MNLKEISNKTRALILLLRNDPDAGIVFRTLFLAICACLILIYSGTTILLTPKNEKLKTMLVERSKLQISRPGLLDDSLAKENKSIEKRILGLSESIAEAELKEKLLKKQWSAMGDEKLFNRTVLTLTSDAPVKMEESLNKIDSLGSHSKGIFTIYPVAVEGEAKFKKLLTYLHFLENRKEVAFMDSLTLSSGEFEKTIKFTLMLGRAHMTGVASVP